MEEEAGIKVQVDELEYVGKHALATSKATEYVHCFAVFDVTFNSEQSLDENEEIEVLTVTSEEIDAMIESGEIIGTPSIANWYLFKKKFFRLKTLK